MDEQTLSELELQDEAYGKQVSIEEKKAIIREAKRRYDKDWTKFFSGFMGKGRGIDWQALKFRMS
jgi:hypothetical protein